MLITLKTLHLFTEQQVFDYVVDHLRRQGVRSMDKYDLCKYRGENGLKCAGGCLIADDEYQPDMEGRDWHKSIFPDAHKSLVRQLQIVHDSYTVEYWEIGFERVAKEFNLEYKGIDHEQ